MRFNKKAQQIQMQYKTKRAGNYFYLFVYKTKHPHKPWASCQDSRIGIGKKLGDCFLNIYSTYIIIYIYLRSL